MLTDFLGWLATEGYISWWDHREDSPKHEEFIEKDKCSFCGVYMDVDDEREKCPGCDATFGEPIVRNRSYVRK